jgi:hypothetical protein
MFFHIINFGAYALFLGLQNLSLTDIKKELNHPKKKALFLVALWNEFCS